MLCWVCRHACVTKCILITHCTLLYNLFILHPAYYCCLMIVACTKCILIAHGTLFSYHVCATCFCEMDNTVSLYVALYLRIFYSPVDRQVNKEIRWVLNTVSSAVLLWMFLHISTFTHGTLLLKLYVALVPTLLTIVRFIV